MQVPRAGPGLQVCGDSGSISGSAFGGGGGDRPAGAPGTTLIFTAARVSFLQG